MQITIAETMEALQEALIVPAKNGKRLALVPTMGALHEGHKALIRHAATLADVVIVSIFVNPRQFGPNEDYAKYPRMLEQDIKSAEEAGASFVYTPSVDDLYPEGYSTSISAGPLANELCGAFRPGHFDGVATIVAKLLLRTLPHVAVFGEKDYQQLTIINRVVDDLDIPVEIVGMPTIREADGLALSSRNAYLSQNERAIAPQLYQILAHTGRLLVASERPVADIIDESLRMLTMHGFKVDYLELRDSDTLAPLENFAMPARLLVAAWLGNTRLIDNLPLE